MLGLDETGIPCHRVSDAVDVVPSPCVEPDEMFSERGANLHQLIHGLELLNEDVDLDVPDRELQEPLERGQHLVPDRRFLGGLNLRQVEDNRGAALRRRWWLLMT